MLVSKEVSTD